MAQATISITVNGEAKEVEATTTGVELFAEDKNIIAVKINGENRDLYTPLNDGDTVDPIALDSEDGLAIMRHSATHVMAQAVQEVYPNAKLGVGPVIKDGFYYDFQVDQPFTPNDLKDIEKRMQRIIKSSQSFRRRSVTEEEALKEEADQPFKIELIEDKEAHLDPAAATEISEKELSFYDNVDRDGNVVWKDLCRGPHLPNTRYIKAFKIERSAAAYWRGSEKNPTMQRVYGTAWATKEDLKAYQTRLEEAAKRDHRKLGAEMDLFSFPDEIGPGLAVFHPKGAAVINAMEDYSREMHRKHHYSFVQTPHITKGGLYETSGHLHWYKDGMYPPMHLDEEYDADGNITKPGADYYLKPMNCPMHNLIFKSRQRSYRELPLRLFEFGTVYRYEKSGEVHGLTRVRGLTQDDSHIYCTREQMKDELTSLLTFVLNLLKDFGLSDFYLELSTKDPDKYVGSDEIWEEATRTLREVAEASHLDLVADPGGAAFYGPKISVHGPRRDRPYLAGLDHPARLQPRPSVSSSNTSRGRHPPASGDDSPCPVWLHRTLLRRAAGALCRCVPGMARPRAGARRAGGRRVRAASGRFRQVAGGRDGPLRDRLLRRPLREEDPQRLQVQGAVHPHRRRGRHEQQRGELPLP